MPTSEIVSPHHSFRKSGCRSTPITTRHQGCVARNARLGVAIATTSTVTAATSGKANAR